MGADDQTEIEAVAGGDSAGATAMRMRSDRLAWRRPKSAGKAMLLHIAIFFNVVAVAATACGIVCCYCDYFSIFLYVFHFIF